MARIDQFNQPCRIDMGVDLGGGDVSMTKQRLQHTQVSPSLQQVRGKGVAQHVGRDLFGCDISPSRQFAQQLKQTHPGKVAGFTTRRKQMLSASRPHCEPESECCFCPSAHRNQTLLATFAGDMQEWRITRNGIEGE